MKTLSSTYPLAHGNTLVTACDKGYFWGVLLLVGSIRMNHCTLPIQIHTHGLSPRKVALLKQFENIEVIPCLSSAPHLNKPKALLNAQTEYVTWVDADCIFKGNLESLLAPHHQGIHIRFREGSENKQVFSLRKQKHLNESSIPDDILNIWQKDVGEREVPLHLTQCVSNFLSVHESSREFIEKWASQIDRLHLNNKYTFDSSSKAYFMTDESVLSSLFSFAHDSPAVYPYQLDKLENTRLIHFGMCLKPWSTWRNTHFKHYDYVMKVVDYLKDNLEDLPPLPHSLDAGFKNQSYINSLLASTFERLKYQFKRALA